MGIIGFIYLGGVTGTGFSGCVLHIVLQVRVGSDSKPPESGL
jgi:hypothetical protein